MPGIINGSNTGNVRHICGSVSSAKNSDPNLDKYCPCDSKWSSSPDCSYPNEEWKDLIVQEYEVCPTARTSVRMTGGASCPCLHFPTPMVQAQLPQYCHGRQECKHCASTFKETCDKWTQTSGPGTFNWRTDVVGLGGRELVIAFIVSFLTLLTLWTWLEISWERHEIEMQRIVTEAETKRLEFFWKFFDMISYLIKLIISLKV